MSHYITKLFCKISYFITMKTVLGGYRPCRYISLVAGLCSLSTDVTFTSVVEDHQIVMDGGNANGCTRFAWWFTTAHIKELRLQNVPKVPITDT
jgi:hypothetical protein